MRGVAGVPPHVPEPHNEKVHDLFIGEGRRRVGRSARVFQTAIGTSKATTICALHYVAGGTFHHW